MVRVQVSRCCQMLQPNLLATLDWLSSRTVVRLHRALHRPVTVNILLKRNFPKIIYTNTFSTIVSVEYMIQSTGMKQAKTGFKNYKKKLWFAFL